MGTFGATWGVAGVILLLSSAISRLLPIWQESMTYDLDWRHWTVMLVNAVFMAHSEGYSAFQKAFAPRIVVRADTLRTDPQPLRVLLAPLFCMGFFHATRRRMITSFAVSAMVCVFIIVFRFIPQPWRGVLDFGVVVGLSWGVAALVFFAWQQWLGSGVNYPAELPGSD